jgi:para-nitrobenzyl esterase
MVTRRVLLKHSLLIGGASLAMGAALPTLGRDNLVVTTRFGKIRGALENGVYVFRGVPYGADTSKRRFLPPLSSEPWKGIREARSYGPACPQRSIDEATGEDCLRLNVWTPTLRNDRKRPVLVYFHGGEFSSGSGSSPIYDGTRLCARGDVVVVTVNHRLNAFGHLYLARIAGREYAASGNVGLLDLILALRWIRDHAETFGGDPNCITVFGQSGGGAKIATLMAMPEAKGLFHRAMTMSGQQITASGPRSATERALAFLNALGIRPNEAARLNDIPVAEIVEATKAADATMVGRSLYFGPVQDFVSLPRHPFYPDAPAQSAHIPMIIGNTLDETRAFLGNEPGVHSLSWEALPNRLLADLLVDIDPEVVSAEYRRWYPQLTPTQVFFAATTAGRSWRGALIELELRAAQGASTFAYQLNYRSPLEGGRYGAMHTMDIPLVFDNIAQPGSLTGVNAAARKTADQMSDTLIAFARTGNPNHPGIPEWRPYDLARRSTMLFDAHSRVEDDPRGAERRLFAQVPYIQRGTY